MVFFLRFDFNFLPIIFLNLQILTIFEFFTFVNANQSYLYKNCSISFFNRILCKKKKLKTNNRDLTFEWAVPIVYRLKNSGTQVLNLREPDTRPFLEWSMIKNSQQFQD